MRYKPYTWLLGLLLVLAAGKMSHAQTAPITTAPCDYSTSTVKLTSSAGSAGPGVITTYILASLSGQILQISPTPSFTGLSGSASYQAFSLVYSGTVSGLALGSPVTSLVASGATSCFAVSNPLLVNTCIPVPTPPCDFTTSTVNLTNSAGSTGPGISTAYMLASPSGQILQISSTPSFTGLLGTAAYQALAVTYTGTISNLAVGSAVSSLTVAGPTSCFAISNPFAMKVCVTPNATCDYQIGQPFTLKGIGGSTGAGIKTSYALADATGKLAVISATATFITAGLAPGVYTAYAFTYADDNTLAGLTVNSGISQITASCLALSAGLPLRLCRDCVTTCLPISVIRIRRTF